MLLLFPTNPAFFNADSRNIPEAHSLSPFRNVSNDPEILQGRNLMNDRSLATVRAFLKYDQLIP